VMCDEDFRSGGQYPKARDDRVVLPVGSEIAPQRREYLTSYYPIDLALACLVQGDQSRLATSSR
jgi:hypothetical protein